METKKRVQFHIVHKDGNWVLSWPIAELPKTKEEVVKEAAHMLNNLHDKNGINSELIIHNINGEIEDKRTYGDDPEYCDCCDECRHECVMDI